jgi:hypothetical protein
VNGVAWRRRIHGLDRTRNPAFLREINHFGLFSDGRFLSAACF